MLKKQEYEKYTTSLVSIILEDFYKSIRQKQSTQ